jgi:DNA mismatch repair protein MutH
LQALVAAYFAVTIRNMAKDQARMAESIALPPARISIGITGHRRSNADFAANEPVIVESLKRILDAADRVTARHGEAAGATRLYSLIAHGADMIAMNMAFARNWEVIAPLPFGFDLNVAISAEPRSAAAARALLAGDDCGEEPAATMAKETRVAGSKCQLFALAEQDEAVSHAFLYALENPGDATAQQHLSTLIAERVAAAGRVMIEQTDLLVAIWDGITPGALGGTRHTIAAALKVGTPVIWIDAAQPHLTALLQSGEELFSHGEARHLLDEAGLEALFDSTLSPPESEQNEKAIRFHTEIWHKHSHRRFHAYRRIEALFGGNGWRGRMGRLVQHYEQPDAIAAGSGAPLLTAARALPGSDGRFARDIEVDVLQRFAWADGLSTYLSDAYRGGMVTNFLLSALAIMVGVSYLPLASVDLKWPFAAGEFLLLVMILAITTIGRRRRWHGRWFETRRVAEYFRHAPILLLLGVARSSGRWPRGADTEWPEYYAREVLRELGLPRVMVTQAYLKSALTGLLKHHASSQRSYHEGKAQRLTRVHHNLDKLSETLFLLAVLSVSAFLALLAASQLGLLSPGIPHKLSKSFTFLGVILPALGGAFAGIRYFGDFERFAAISEVTAEKLSEVERRIETLLAAPEGSLRYSQVADIAHAMDDIVVSEIENWQSVFGGKQIAVPV